MPLACMHIPERPTGNTTVFRFVSITIIIIALSVLTFLRNDLWDTKLALWTDTAQKSPMKARVHNALGLSYWIIGRLDEAVVEFKKSQDLDRAHLETYVNFYNLGIAFEGQGNFYQAAYCFDIVCKNAPPLFQRQKQIACDRVAGFLTVNY